MFPGNPETLPATRLWRKRSCKQKPSHLILDRAVQNRCMHLEYAGTSITTCHVSVSMERTNQKLWSAMWYWAIPPVIDHTRSIDLWPSGTKCTGDLPVSHVVWHNTSMGGIMPYHMAGKFEKRTRAYGPGKAVFHCGIPKSVRMEMSLTSSNDSRHCKRKSLKFWSKNVLRKEVQTKRAIKSRSRPGVGRERTLRSLTERDLTIPHCLPFDELARLPTTETFLFTQYGGK